MVKKSNSNTKNKKPFNTSKPLKSIKKITIENKTKKNKSTKSIDLSTMSNSARLRAKRLSEQRLTPVSRDEHKKLFSWDDMNNLDAGVAFEILYGFKPDVNYTTDYNEVINKVNARSWWERSSAQTECGNAIEPIVWGKTQCYICGLPLIQGESTPECEHILPVYKAAVYLTLYRDDYKDIMTKGLTKQSLTQLEKTIFKELRLEYAWSHRCCNQKKSDIDFIKYKQQRGGNGVFELDFNNTSNILNTIVKTTISGGDGHCSEPSMKKAFIKMFGSYTGKQLNSQISKWIKDRIDVLQAKNTGKIRNITDYLNSFGNAHNSAMFTLLNLCNIISAADMTNVTSIWRTLEGRPPPIKEIPPIIQIEKASVIMNISEYINQIIVGFDWGRTLGSIGYVMAFYQSMFEIPTGIKFELRRKVTERTIEMSGNVTEAILGTLLYINTNDVEYGDFFVKFFSVLTYPSQKVQDTIFPGNFGKQYASHMVGISLKLLYLLRFKLNLETKSNLEPDIYKHPTYIQFNGLYQLKLLDVVNDLSKLKNKYFEAAKVAVSDNDTNPYYVYLFTFVAIVTEINKNMASILSTLLVDGTIDMNDKQQLTLLFNPSSSIFNKYNSYVKNNLLFPGNYEATVVKFYMDEAQYLKFYPEWNPDEPDPNDSKFVADAKGIAVGSMGLLSMFSDPNDYIELGEIGDAIGKGVLVDDIMTMCQNNNGICEGVVKLYLPDLSSQLPIISYKESLQTLNEEQLSIIAIEIEKRILINTISNEYANNPDQTMDIINIVLQLNEIQITDTNMIGPALNKLSIEEIKSIMNAITDINSVANILTTMRDNKNNVNVVGGNIKKHTARIRRTIKRPRRM